MGEISTDALDLCANVSIAGCGRRGTNDIPVNDNTKCIRDKLIVQLRKHPVSNLWRPKGVYTDCKWARCDVVPEQFRSHHKDAVNQQFNSTVVSNINIY